MRYFLSVIHQSTLLLFFNSPIRESGVEEIGEQNWEKAQVTRRDGIINSKKGCFHKHTMLSNLSPPFTFNFQFYAINSNNKILCLLQYKLPYICDTFKSPYRAIKGSQTRKDLYSRRGTHLHFLTAVKDQSPRVTEIKCKLKSV